MKTPWSVDAGYGGRVVVRGRRLDGPDVVGFGFWPQGYGTPATQPGVPVLFTHPDQEGRTVEYQAELDVDAPAGGKADGHYWAYPSPGCYAIQADGDGFSNVTIVSVTA